MSDIDLSVSPLEARKETPLSQVDVFNIVRACGLTERFKKCCYEDATPQELDFNPDVQTIYRHDLGLKFLKENHLPSTIEDLNDRTENCFESVTAGRKEYKAGEVVVLFPRPVHHGSDIKDNILVAIVKEDFNFDPEVDLNSGNTEDFIVALRPYTESGKLELMPNPGFRVYNPYTRWTFLERFK